MKNVKQFNVIHWDFNDEEPSAYDVLPYFRSEYERLSKRKRPITREEWKGFIRSKGMYQYWSRCQYEVIISQWPPTEKSYKMDIWQQIEINLDLITDILMEETQRKEKI